MKTLYLCGAGNPDGVRLAQRINESRGCWDRLVVLDDDPAKKGRMILGVTIAGGFSLLSEATPGQSEIANLVARTTAKRLAAQSRMLAHGVPFAQLTDPSVDTVGAELASGTIVYHHATIGAEASVDEGSVVFMGAVVGHECRVGRCCVVGANAVLNARVRLEEGVYVGTNATILPEITIGAWATIGAGSVVLEDVPSGATVMGVPAQVLSTSTERGGAPPCPCPHESADEVKPAAGSDGDLEEVISRIWGEVLGVARVRVDQNFFDMGGSSLHALKVYERLRQTARPDIRITDLFRFPTVQALAGYLGLPSASPARETPHPTGAQRRTVPWRGAARPR